MKHTVEEVRLKNGARGLLIDVPGATAMSMQFQFQAGSRYAKSNDIEQVAHIMEHMAFGANARFKTGADFDAEFTKNGAYQNAYTSDFWMVYEADCADFEWERILDLERLSICEPRFNEGELLAEKGNVRSELTNYLNNYSRLLWQRIAHAMGEGSASDRYGLTTINNVTLADIKEHYKRTHTTKNMRFIVAGNLAGRKSKIRQMIEEFKLPEGERFDIIHDEPLAHSPVVVRRKDASNLVFGMSMTLNRKLDDEEIDALSALNQILTGTMRSRIFGKARANGLSYNIRLYCNGNKYVSSWDLAGQVNHETADKLFDLVVEELQAVLDGKISEEELEAAKSFALGRHQMGAQTAAQILDFYSGRYFGRDIIDDYNKVPDEIRGVTIEKIQKIVREFIDGRTWCLGAVSNGEKQEIIDLGDKLATLFPEK